MPKLMSNKTMKKIQEEADEVAREARKKKELVQRKKKRDAGRDIMTWLERTKRERDRQKEAEANSKAAKKKATKKKVMKKTGPVRGKKATSKFQTVRKNTYRTDEDSIKGKAAPPKKEYTGTYRRRPITSLSRDKAKAAKERVRRLPVVKSAKAAENEAVKSGLKAAGRAKMVRKAGRKLGVIGAVGAAAYGALSGGGDDKKKTKKKSTGATKTTKKATKKTTTTKGKATKTKAKVSRPIVKAATQVKKKRKVVPSVKRKKGPMKKSNPMGFMKNYGKRAPKGR